MLRGFHTLGESNMSEEQSKISKITYIQLDDFKNNFLEAINDISHSENHFVIINENKKLATIKGLLAKEDKEEVDTQDTKNNVVTTIVNEDLKIASQPLITLNVGKNIIEALKLKTKDNRFIDDLIPLLRNGLNYETGIKIPGVSVRGHSTDIPANSFNVELRNQNIFEGQVEEGMFCVGCKRKELKDLGITYKESKHPIDQKPIFWIDNEHINVANDKDWRYWDTEEYIITELSHVLKIHVDQFITVQFVASWLNQLKETGLKETVEILVPEILSIPQLTPILKKLIQENISLVDGDLVLSTIAIHAEKEKKHANMMKKIMDDLESKKMD